MNSQMQELEKVRLADEERILDVFLQGRHSIHDVVTTLKGLQPHLEMVNAYAAHFNLLYLRVTEQIQEFERLGLYCNPEFLRVLDVRFAERYLQALVGWLLGEGDVPGAWMLLFEPEDPGLDPTQYAALGVNAHINVDLALALIATFDELEIDPRENSPEHHDYLMVNQVFYEVIPPLRRIFHGFRTHASLLDALENWIVQVIIDETRDQAWDEACRFWRKRHRDGYLGYREQKLDFTACMVGDAIASPVCQHILDGTDPEEHPTFYLDLGRFGITSPTRHPRRRP